MHSGRETTGAQRRRLQQPERGALHQVLREHLVTFLARASEQDGTGLPRFVTRELERMLTCGILAYGFARLRCTQCGQDELVAFSCKGRGFCPSCGGRRMAETAARLLDEVLPEDHVRRWELALPIASDPPGLRPSPAQRGARHLRPHDPRLAARARRGRRHSWRQLERRGFRTAIRRRLRPQRALPRAGPRSRFQGRAWRRETESVAIVCYAHSGAPLSRDLSGPFRVVLPRMKDEARDVGELAVIEFTDELMVKSDNRRGVPEHSSEAGVVHGGLLRSRASTDDPRGIVVPQAE